MDGRTDNLTQLTNNSKNMLDTLIKESSLENAESELINNRNLDVPSSERYEDNDEDAEDDSDEEEDNDQNSNIPSKFPTLTMEQQEIIHEDGKDWIPIHLLTKSKNLCWTHFLALDEHITLAKCKHCGLIIKRSVTPNDKPSTQTFRRHLQTKHKVFPKDNFYVSQQQQLFVNLPRQSVINNPEYKMFDDSSTKSSLDISGIRDLDGLFSAKDSNFSNSTLLALICVLQNFKFSFINIDTFESLFQLLHLSVHVTPEDIMEKIEDYGNAIDNLVFSSLRRNAENINFQLNSHQITKANLKNDEVIYNFINTSLNQLLDSPLFSISQYYYNSEYFIISLQYCDRSMFQRQCLPLVIIPAALDKSEYFELMKSEFHKLFMNNEDLNKSTLSITLPSQLNELRSIALSQSSNNLDNINFHPCFGTDLSNSILPFFGYPIHNSIIDNSKEHVTEFTLIDGLINLTGIDIDTSIFGKINRFYNEIESDSDIQERFSEICGKASKHFDIKQLKSFNKNSPSSAVKFLRSFLGYKKQVLIINEYLHEESFTKSDFEVTSTTADILSYTYSLIELYSNRDPNFHNIILTVVTIEKHVRRIIERTTSIKILKQLEIYITFIINLRKNISLDDDLLLSLFFCPAMLHNKELLKIIFPNISFNDIIDRGVQISLRVLRRFLKVKSEKTTRTRTEEKPWSKYERLPFIDFFTTNNAESNADEYLDSVLSSQIRTDLNEYLNVVFSEYNIFFKKELAKTPYVKVGASFINSEKKRTLNLMAELIRIHLPISNAFLKRYMDLEIGIIISVLAKYILSQSAVAYSTHLGFLSNFEPANKENLLETIVKVRAFAEQFQISTIIWDDDDLFSITELPEQPFSTK